MGLIWLAGLIRRDNGYQPRHRSPRLEAAGESSDSQWPEMLADWHDDLSASDGKLAGQEGVVALEPSQCPAAPASAEDDWSRAEDDRARVKDDDRARAEDDRARAEDDDRARAEDDRARAEDDRARAEDDRARAEDDRSEDFLDQLTVGEIRRILEGCAVNDPTEVVPELVGLIAHRSHTPDTLLQAWAQFEEATRDVFALQHRSRDWSAFFSRDLPNQGLGTDPVALMRHQADEAWQHITRGLLAAAVPAAAGAPH